MIEFMLYAILSVTDHFVLEHCTQQAQWHIAAGHRSCPRFVSSSCQCLDLFGFLEKIKINDPVGEPLGYIAASESCAFPAGTVFHAEVEPGEMVEISRKGIRSVWQVHN